MQSLCNVTVNMINSVVQELSNGEQDNYEKRFSKDSIGSCHSLFPDIPIIRYLLGCAEKQATKISVRIVGPWTIFEPNFCLLFSFSLSKYLPFSFTLSSPKVLCDIQIPVQLACYKPKSLGLSVRRDSPSQGFYLHGIHIK
jgi:hypothetical protein